MQGIVLTSCYQIGDLLAYVRGAQMPLLKVVTGWGYHWDANSRAEVCQTMPELIVRTVSGDGTRGPPEGQTSIWCDPGAVMAEIEPWYSQRPSIQIELGNEPNGYDPSDDAAWNFRYWFLETLQTVRAAFPRARVVSPGLIENRQLEWWAICQDAFEMADSIGFHAYAYHDCDDTGQLGRALDQLGTMFLTKSWCLTEYGIHDPGTSPNIKAQRYASMHSKLPSQVASACWYHYCDQPIDDDQRAYALPPSALPYLYAGGTL